MYGPGSDGYIDLSSALSGPVESGSSVLFETPTDVTSSMGPDTYTATFTVSSNADTPIDGDNNSVEREFAITSN